MRLQTETNWPLAAALLLAAVLAVTPVLDQRASANYESLFQRALVTFALARTLNGIISAVQGTEVALQPAGVGVTLTPGEILDPVNDLVERFSWIMLGATVSLGIQQVLLEVSGWWVIQGLVVVLALWLLAVLLVRDRSEGTSRKVLIRLFLIALFLRFAVPLTMIANEAVYELFLEPRYQASTEVVNSAGEELGKMSEQATQVPELEEDGGGFFLGDVIGTMGQAISDAASGMDLKARVAAIQQRARELIEHLVQLSVVFILQTGLLPIAFLWLFLQLAKWCVRPLPR